MLSSVLAAFLYRVCLSRGQTTGCFQVTCKSCQGKEVPLHDHLLVKPGLDAQLQVSSAAQAATSTETEREAWKEARLASHDWCSQQNSICDPVAFCRNVKLFTPPVTHLPGCHGTCKAWDKALPFTLCEAHGQGHDLNNIPTSGRTAA